MTYEKVFEEIKKCFAQPENLNNAKEFAFQINITGEGEGIMYIALKGGILEIAPYDYLDNDATIIADSHVLLDMFSGKTSPEAAYLTGKVKVRGNLGLVAEFVKYTKPKKENPKKFTIKKSK